MLAIVRYEFASCFYYTRQRNILETIIVKIMNTLLSYITIGLKAIDFCTENAPSGAFVFER